MSDELVHGYAAGSGVFVQVKVEDKVFTPADRKIKVAGVNIRFWMEGEGSAVILIHGLSNSIEDWLLNIEALAGQHRVYALDLLGHGRADKPLTASYRIGDLSQYLIQFMDALGIKQAHLVGHSLGGAIALTAAHNYPTYCNKLVLVDSAGLAQECSILLRLLSVPGLGELLGSLFMPDNLEKYISMQRKSWPDMKIVPDEMMWLKYSATRWQDIHKTYFKALRAMCNFRGTRPGVFTPIVQNLTSLTNPVLVVWGEQDDLLPVSQARIVKDKVPHARVEIFENCKHDPMITNPERFSQLVLEFLKD